MLLSSKRIALPEAGRAMRGVRDNTQKETPDFVFIITRKGVKKVSMLARVKILMTEKKYSLYRALRKDRRLTLTSVAIAAGVSPETQARTERGEREPTKEEVIRMDKKFGCNGELIDIWIGKKKFSFGKKRSPVRLTQANRLRKILYALSIPRFYALIKRGYFSG